MSFMWSFLASPKNQKTLSWLGGGLVVAATGVWAAVTYFWPHPGTEAPAAPVICAQNQSLAAGGNVSGNTITMNGGATASPGVQAAPCVDMRKP